MHIHHNQHQLVQTIAQQFTPYFIIARHSGKALDVKGGNNANGTELHQWDLHKGANQQFYFDAKWRLISVASGKAVDIYALAQNDGAKLVIWDPNDGKNQQWAYQNGLILSLMNSKAIDVCGASKDNGASVFVWSLHGGANQQWDLVPVYK